MNLKKLFSVRYWIPNRRSFRERYNEDRLFNATFRDEKSLSRQVEKSLEMKYIRLYRLTQANQGKACYRLLIRRLKRLSERTGVGLYTNMNIGRGLIIGHIGTIVINGFTKFGDELMLTHGVTIGRDVRGPRKGTPIIGNRVCIRANATVVGKITIGDDVLIAPNSFVNFDVPSHSIVVGNPAVVHHRENATEGHLGYIEVQAYE